MRIVINADHFLEPNSQTGVRLFQEMISLSATAINMLYFNNAVFICCCNSSWTRNSSFAAAKGDAAGNRARWSLLRCRPVLSRACAASEVQRTHVSVFATCRASSAYRAKRSRSRYIEQDVFHCRFEFIASFTFASPRSAGQSARRLRQKPADRTHTIANDLAGLLADGPPLAVGNHPANFRSLILNRSFAQTGLCAGLTMVPNIDQPADLGQSGIRMLKSAARTKMACATDASDCRNKMPIVDSAGPRLRIANWIHAAHGNRQHINRAPRNSGESDDR